MKRNILYIMLIAVSVGLLVGCASSKRNNVVSVSPSPYVLTPDGSNRVRLDMSFHVPEHYMTRRSRLIITPQLMADDSVKEEYMPVVLDAPIYSKKKERLEKLTDYSDPYGDRAQKADKVSRSFDIPYTDTIQLPDGTDEGRIRAVISVDGCGDCAGVGRALSYLRQFPRRNGYRYAWYGYFDGGAFKMGTKWNNQADNYDQPRIVQAFGGIPLG